MGIKKIIITPEQLYNESFSLARKIFDSGFLPHVMISIMRGGVPIGLCLQEYIEHATKKKSVIFNTAIKIESYNGLNKRRKSIKIYGIDSLKSIIKKGEKILIVDDVFDKGLTIKGIVEEIKKHIKEELDIKTATLYYKPENNQTDITPDFYFKVFKKDDWIVFPHELNDLSKEDIKKKGKIVYKNVFS